MASNMDNSSKPHGVYKNPRLMHASTSIVGSTVHLQTTTGSVWEGIFNTFNPEFTICLNLAIEIDPKLSRKDNLYAALKAGKRVEQQAFFDLKDIVRISVIDIDINSTSIDQTKLTTDTDISGYNAGKSSSLGGKQLETWQDDDGDDVNEDSMLSLDDVALPSKKNDSQNKSCGWDAQEMFSYNERVHKVTTTYDEKLTDYTVPLPKPNTKDWVKKQMRAAVIAKEIEGNTDSQSRLAKEDEGDCEEEKFSAVVRPSPPVNRPPSSSNNMMHKNFRPRTNYDRSRMERIDSLKNFSNKLNIGPSPRQPHQSQKQQQQQQHQQQHQNQPNQHQSQQPHQQQSQQPSQHQPQKQHQQQQPLHHQQSQMHQQHQHQPQQTHPQQHQPQSQPQQHPQHQHIQHQHPQQQYNQAQPKQQTQSQTQNQSHAQSTTTPATVSRATTTTTSTQQTQVQSTNTTATPSSAASPSVNTSTLSERSDSSSLGSQAKDHQSELARKSKLNPNAKEFVYKPNQGAQTTQLSGTPAIDPNTSSPMTQAYYQQVPIFPHGLSPQQQHHAAQFMPHPYMTSPYIRGNFQNYHPRGEHHNNVRAEYPQASMMVPSTTAGQPFVPQPPGAQPHPMNAYAPAPQQQMIYNGQSMYPIPPQNWPRFWLDGGFW